MKKLCQIVSKIWKSDCFASLAFKNLNFARTWIRVSSVTCHLSHVQIFFSHFFNIYKKILFKKIGQSDGGGWWSVCYQRGLPHLVSLNPPLDQLVHMSWCLCVWMLCHCNKNSKVSFHFCFIASRGSDINAVLTEIPFQDKAGDRWQVNGYM